MPDPVPNEPAPSEQNDYATRVSIEDLVRLFDLSVDLICLLGFDGYFKRVNTAFVRLLGWRREELLSRPFTDFVHPDDRESTAAEARKLALGKMTEDFVNRYRTSAGEYRFLSWRAVAATDHDVILGIARDVTETRKREFEEREKEARFELIFQKAPIAMLWRRMDKDQPTSRWNEAYRKMFNLQPGQMPTAEFVAGLTHPEDAKIQACLRAELEAGKRDEFVLEKRYRPPGGEEFWARLTVGVVRDTNGGIQQKILIIENIHEQKLTENRLQEHSKIIDSARDAIVVRNLHHKITFWNKGAEHMYGYSSAEALDQQIDGLLYRDPGDFLHATRTVLESGEWHGELKQIAKGGRELTADCSWTLLRNDDGTPRGILAINSDITDRKKLEEQLLRAQRLESIGTLAGGVAHDLNNMLSPILMGIGLLREHNTDPTTDMVLANMEKSARRGGDLVQQVLSFARGMDGKRIDLSLRLLVDDFARIVRDTFPGNIVIDVSVADDTGSVSGDPTQLHQVLLNLCVNSRDAMPDGGRLAITVKNTRIDANYAGMQAGAEPGAYVLIEVADTGSGIDPADRDRIFDPFFTTKDVGQGTGLGLATVQTIVKNHGGFVTFYSERDKGTTFKTYLPAIESSESKSDSASSSLPRGRGETILVVDDEPSVLDITRQTLEAFGYRVLTASDGADAVGVYAANRDRIAVVLTDMAMPIMDGPALIAAIRRLKPDARIVGASGYRGDRRITENADSGICSFLPKPYTAESLLSALANALKE